MGKNLKLKIIMRKFIFHVLMPKIIKSHFHNLKLLNHFHNFIIHLLMLLKLTDDKNNQKALIS